MSMIVDANLGLAEILKKGKTMLAPGGQLQMFIDTTILNQIEPYIPMKVGTATKSGILHSKIGYGMLIWKTPYIRVIYYGVHPRTGTPLRYNQSRHPLAGKLWAIRYKADHLQELAGMIQGKAGTIWSS